MFKVVITTKGLANLPRKLARFRVGILERIPVMLALIGEEIAAIAKQDYLSGPRSRSKLGVVSGDLRRSITRGADGNVYRLSGNKLVMGTNLPYAAAHEYGFHETVQISAHTREVKAVFGRASGVVRQFVSAHSRKMNLRERPFLRPAVKDSLPGARSIIQRLANEALREAVA